MFHSLSFLRGAAGIAILALATACSSGSNNPIPTPATSQGMSWTVNGINMTTAQIRVVRQASYLPAGYIEVIGAYNTTTASNGMDLVMPKAVGTYAVTDSVQDGPKAAYVVAAGLSGGGSSSAMFGHVGTITITSLTATEMVGTFSFSGTGSGTGAPVQQTITNGKFNVNL